MDHTRGRRPALEGTSQPGVQEVRGEAAPGPVRVEGLGFAEEDARPGGGHGPGVQEVRGEAKPRRGVLRGLEVPAEADGPAAGGPAQLRAASKRARRDERPKKVASAVRQHDAWRHHTAPPVHAPRQCGAPWWAGRCAGRVGAPEGAQELDCGRGRGVTGTGLEAFYFLGFWWVWPRASETPWLPPTARRTARMRVVSDSLLPHGL
ncbi:uncharacterized protein LOC129640259 [Bubalus kerabau]|uniref:uncharacterized protein LOC129640259 n=1 Tax=Bubalus carabanensis TaxID=3119969 RepID=UPI00244EA42D|nr:uncharacterized protein LOC129640259 [Bubalus carabanensis]